MTPPGRARPAPRRTAAAVVLAVALGSAPSPSLAAHVEIVAEVQPDLRTIRGALRAVDLDDARWVDAIGALPVPTHDLDVQRTFPGAPNTGRTTWEPVGEWLAFTTHLPRRFGDTGATAAGLWANGGWYPQPLVDDALPLIDWQVTVRLPDGVTGAVGDRVGQGTLTWRGTGDRASLAALRRGARTELAGPGWTLSLLTPGRPRPGLVRGLTQQLDLATASLPPLDATAVQAPLRRRLAVAGGDLAYVSDRAWRVFPWFARLHHPGPIRALWASSLPDPDPFVRGIAAASLSTEHRRRLARRQAVDLLGLTRWIPAVDAALYDQEMPFQDDIFRRAHPVDRVRDELIERLAPSSPVAAAAAQLADRHGEPAVLDMARRLAAGWPLQDAAQAAGVDPAPLQAMRGRYPTQDYTLQLDGAALTVTRLAPDDGLAEPVVLSIDGTRRTLPGQVGPWSETLTLDARPHIAALDPDGHLGQSSRVGERLPGRVRWTLTGQISGINVSERFVSAFAVLTARRTDDTFNRWRVWLATNQREHLSTRLTWTRFFGPILRGNTRRHGLTLGVETSWLNRRFSPFADADVAIGGSLSWAWDSRVYSLFPTRGTALDAGVSVGGAPQTGDTYVRLGGSAARVVSLHPRHVLAGRVELGAAWTDIPQERLTFGGAAGVRGVPDDVIQTSLQAIGTVEYRVAPLRQASIPLGPVYLSEIDLVAGLDVGVGRSGDDPIGAVGAAVGVGVIVDNFGLSPGAAVVSLGFPLWTSGFEIPPDAPPVAVYLRWGQAF